MNTTNPPTEGGNLSRGKFRGKKLRVIFLSICGVAILGTASFFAQKYVRLYLAYMDFEDYQYYLSQRNEFYGESNKIQDWSFGRYLQYLDEVKGAEKKALEEQEKLLDVYRQDTVGGKTPEETLAGFVDALKKKDFDLASKYFWLDKQEEWKKNLTEAEDAGELNETISDLENAPKVWEKSINEDSAIFSYKKYFEERKLQLPDGVGGFIDQTFPAGEYKQKIIFKFNPYSNVWKMEAF